MNFFISLAGYMITILVYIVILVNIVIFFTSKLLTLKSLFDAERYISKHKLNHM